jgi:hypothetical protein
MDHTGLMGWYVRGLHGLINLMHQFMADHPPINEYHRQEIQKARDRLTQIVDGGGPGRYDIDAQKKPAAEEYERED